MIYFTNINTPIGTLGLIGDGNLLLRIYLPNKEILKSFLHKQYPDEDIIEDKSGYENITNQLTEYFDGKRKQFTIKTKLDVSSFYKEVLEEVAKVPYGKTVSYNQIAQKLNNPKATRAVGTANARNPLPIIIPCHRIITKDGKLGGYAGGLKIKKYLLDLERDNLNLD